MISKVSFGSTYKITTDGKDKKQAKAYANTLECCEAINIPYEEKHDIQSKYPYNFLATSTIVVPDSQDADIEAYFNAIGINYFNKRETADLLNPKSIISRISEPNNTYRQVLLNKEKFEELVKNQEEGNIKYCEQVYEKHYKPQTDFIIKSGDEFATTTLSLTPMGKTEEMLDYINTWGADNLNPNSLFIDFSKRTDDADHCMYFAMKDIGMENIPVYVDNESYKIGKALGLFKEN